MDTIKRAVGPVIGSAILALGAYFSAKSILVDELRTSETIAVYADYVSSVSTLLFSEQNSRDREQARLKYYETEARIAIYGSEEVIGAAVKFRNEVGGKVNAKEFCGKLEPVLATMREHVWGDIPTDELVKNMQFVVLGDNC